MDKRQFIKSAGASALLVSLGFSLESCVSEVEDPSPINSGSNKLELDLNDSKYSVLKNREGWLLDNTNGLLLVNIDGNILAFSNSCPHSGCTNSWRYNNQKFTCTCHNSVFSAEGALISGPAQEGLRQIRVTIIDDILTVG